MKTAKASMITSVRLDPVLHARWKSTGMKFAYAIAQALRVPALEACLREKDKEIEAKDFVIDKLQRKITAMATEEAELLLNFHSEK